MLSVPAGLGFVVLIKATFRVELEDCSFCHIFIHLAVRQNEVGSRGSSLSKDSQLRHGLSSVSWASYQRDVP